MTLLSPKIVEDIVTYGFAVLDGVLGETTCTKLMQDALTVAFPTAFDGRCVILLNSISIFFRRDRAISFFRGVVNLLITTSKAVAEQRGIGHDYFSDLTTDEVRFLVGNPIPEDAREPHGLVAVIFLNPNWQRDFGGELELSPLMPNTSAKIPPVFDRIVIYHGICYPVMLPARSISLSCTLVYKKSPSI